MTTMMSNVAIVTTLPRFQNYFNYIENIEFYSRLMLTLPSLIVAILSPILGIYIFKFGKKKSAFFALTLFALTGSAGLYLEHLQAFLLSRALFGIAVATQMIVATSLVGDYFKGEARHKFMGYQSAFMAVGGITFVFGGGILSDINWRLPFGIYLIGILLLPMVYLFLIEKKSEIADNLETTVSTNLFGIYFLGFFYMIIFFILPTQIPFLIIDTFGGTGKMAGSVIGLAFFANAMGAITFSKLKKYYNFSTIYLIGFFILGFGYTGVGLINNIYLFFITSTILGFGGGVMMTNVTAWMLSRTTFERRVKSSSFMTSSMFLGQFISPIVFHPFVSSFGVQNAFLLVGVFLFFIVISSTIFIRLRANS